MGLAAGSPSSFEFTSPAPASQVCERPTNASSFEPHLGDMAGVLSHRIRNIIAGIEGCTTLLTDTLGTREQRELALRILEGVSRIEDILVGLQDYSRPIEVVPLPIRVDAIVERVLAALPDEAVQRLVLDVRAASAPVSADPSLLQQALLLLVQNALEASPAGGDVSLSVRADPAAASVTFEVGNDGIMVVDTPPGRIFDPFFTTKSDALGIGLPLAHRIATAHGGSLVLTSNSRDEGTRFALAIPAARDEALVL